MVTLSFEGKIAALPIPDDQSQMAQHTCRFTHVLAELELRGESYKDERLRELLYVPNPTDPMVRKAINAVSQRALPRQRYLVRYGNEKWMRLLHENGRIRIRGASFYDDPSLNRARRDKEKEIAAFVHPSDAHRFMMPDGSDAHVPFHGAFEVALTANTDFFVYCMALACDYRLFQDFDSANSCVLIREVEQFECRLRDAVSGRLPGWKSVATDVRYFDPFFTRPHQLNPYECKHFRYAYQKEYRMIWIPPSGQEEDKLEYLDLEIGPLTDISELISFE